MSAWQKVYYQQVTDVGRVGLDYGLSQLPSSYLFTYSSLKVQLTKIYA